jgi:hypothetical protein
MQRLRVTRKAGVFAGGMGVDILYRGVLGAAHWLSSHIFAA